MMPMLFIRGIVGIMVCIVPMSADFSSPINLYCNEAAGDALSSYADISEIGSLSTNFLIDDDNFIVNSIMSLIKCLNPS